MSVITFCTLLSIQSTSKTYSCHFISLLQLAYPALIKDMMRSGMVNKQKNNWWTKINRKTTPNICLTIFLRINSIITVSFGQLEFWKAKTILTSRRGGLCHNLQQGPEGGESLGDLRWRLQGPGCSGVPLFRTPPLDTIGLPDYFLQMPSIKAKVSQKFNNLLLSCIPFSVDDTNKAWNNLI